MKGYERRKMAEKDIIAGLNNIAAKYGYGKGTEPFTDDEWNTIFRANGIIKHLTAENQRLKEEVEEQKEIAAHEHATQMEWFSIACDYVVELVALKNRLENAVEIPISDRVWFITEDEEGAESYIISKPADLLTVDELYEIGKKYFTTRKSAKAFLRN